MNCSGDERGVSPVVGGALLIAVLVVLVATAGSMLMGFSDELEQGPSAGAGVSTTVDDGKLNVTLETYRNAEALVVLVNGTEELEWGIDDDDVGSTRTVSGVHTGSEVLIRARTEDDAVIVKQWTVD